MALVMVDLSVSFVGVRFKNPIVTASGTFGFGREYSQYFDLSELGGICVKGLTAKPRPGNKPPRIAETPMGMLNSVGLQNPGVDNFIKDELPFLREYDTIVIANISGNTVDEYAEMAEKLSNAAVDIIEVNVSCPNIKAGGMTFGTSEKSVATVTEAVKVKSSLPVMVKLSPNVTDIASIAKAAENAGADAISLINTILGMRIDTSTRKPVLNNNVGGLSGPAVLPVAVRMVWQVASAVGIPIMGMGGVKNGNDAVEIMLAGADLVGVGTASIENPYAPVRIIKELKEYLSDNDINRVDELTGKVVLN
jgi:dihydroorotate dehydrogenase (NAD+) catalytic subunit